MGSAVQVFTGLNILVDGIGNVGVSKSVEVPKLEFLSVNREGAMAYEEVIPLLKSMSAKIVVNQFHAGYFTAASNLFGAGVVIFCKGSTVQDGVAKSVFISLGGKIKVLENKIPDTGKEVEVTLDIAVTSYKLLLEGIPVVIVDVPNMVCLIGGVDLYSDLRNNIK